LAEENGEAGDSGVHPMIVVHEASRVVFEFKSHLGGDKFPARKKTLLTPKKGICTTTAYSFLV
jgi:hypothetical protein